MLRIFVIFLSLCVFSNCNLNKDPSKNNLDASLIDSIVIIRSQPVNQTIMYTPRQLSPSKIQKLCTAWNDCKSAEWCLYQPAVNLTVYQKDKTARHFRANGGNIKENNDYCYKIGDDSYFYDLCDE